MSANIVVNTIDSIGVRIPVRIGFQTLQYQFAPIERDHISEADT